MKKPLGYEDALWARRGEDMWRTLPDELVATLPLSPAAQLVLQGFLLEQRDEFEEQYHADRNAALGRLDGALFVVLSLAQTEAQERRMPEIEPSCLFQALVRAWTNLWPLCPRGRKG